ncbi:MAG: CHAT domain-containing protein [bacterium]|nr:CHAT domain-containing protein [bacterium]
MIHRGAKLKILLAALILTLWAGTALADEVSRAEHLWYLVETGQLAEARASAPHGGTALDSWCLGLLGDEPADHPMSRAARAHAAGDFAAVATELAAPYPSPIPDVDPMWREARYGEALVALRRNAEADSVLTLAIAKAREFDQPMTEAFALMHRGRARIPTREAEPPRQDLLAAVAIIERLDLPGWEGRCAIALSVVSRLQMDLDDALHWRERALDAYTRAGDPAGQARSRHYIATIHIMRGDLTRAMVGLQEALAVARESGDQAILGGVLGEMASVNYLLGDFDGALAQYEEAIRLADHPWRRGMMLVNVGSLHEYRGEYEAAREVQTEALALMRQVGDHRTEAAALQSLGEVLCELKEFEAGLAYLDTAVTVAREYNVPMTEAYALKCRGHGLLVRGDLDEAAAVLAEAAALGRRIGYFEVLEWSLLKQAEVARRQGRTDEALSLLEEALASVADVRRRSAGSGAVATGLASQAVPIGIMAVDLLHQLHTADPSAGHDRRAFAVVQEVKARVFLDQLVEAEFDLRHSAVPGYREQEADLTERLAMAEARLDSLVGARAPAAAVTATRAARTGLEDELQLLETRLRREDPRYAAVLYPEPLGLDDLGGDLLRPDELFLEYALGDSASFLWAARGDVTRFVALPPRREIEAQVRALLPLLADYNLTGGDPAWLVPPARRLHETLLGPVADLVADAPGLVVSPDGVLHYLPFGALVAADSAGPTCADVPWLALSHVVTVTPSASVLATVRARPPVAATSPWLLAGDPRLAAGGEAGVVARAAGAEDLAPLPHAARELAAVAAATVGATVLSGADATPTRLAAAGRAVDHDQVHLATHGLYNENRPRWSGLVLSPDPVAGDDGFLAVDEVLGLRLVCNQVTLAACASGLGEEVSGEGLVGLTRSFLFAGARSVVAALWDVPGAATSALMGEYYGRDEFRAGRRAEALAAAQRALITGAVAAPDGTGDWTHPSAWAAFTISGEGR